MQLLPQCNNASSVYKAVSGHSSTLLCCLSRMICGLDILFHAFKSRCPPAHQVSHFCVRDRMPLLRVFMLQLKYLLGVGIVYINFDSKNVALDGTKLCLCSGLMVHQCPTVQWWRTTALGIGEKKNRFSFLTCVTVFTRAELEPVYFWHVFSYGLYKHSCNFLLMDNFLRILVTCKFHKRQESSLWSLCCHYSYDVWFSPIQFSLKNQACKPLIFLTMSF